MSLYYEARREHAWLLRAEGLTIEEIAKRLGYQTRLPGLIRTRQMILLFGYRVNSALAYIPPEPKRQRRLSKEQRARARNSSMYLVESIRSTNG